MKSRNTKPRVTPQITVRVSGKLFQGHLAYLDQLVQSATECELWPLLNLAQLKELDRDALFYLIDGEDRQFAIISCPAFIHDWMDHERARSAA